MDVYVWDLSDSAITNNLECPFRLLKTTLNPVEDNIMNNNRITVYIRNAYHIRL